MRDEMRYSFFPVTACNMCGSTAFQMLGMRLSASQGLNPRRVEGVAIPVKRCRDCGLVFSDPQPVPEKLSDHYGLAPESYWGCREWSSSYFYREIETAKRLLDFTAGMKALDIGAGEGFAMKSLAVAGFDTWGIEPSEPFRRYCISRLGIDAKRLELAAVEDAEFPREKFDFITFGAVLEHLFDPRGAIDRAMAWLRPGGIIQIEVPSSNWLISKLVNIYFRLRGTNYVTNLSPMHKPYHLYEFTLDCFKGYEVAEHDFQVCYVPHVPAPLKSFFRRFMDATNTGMQLTVYLRKPQT